MSKFSSVDPAIWDVGYLHTTSYKLHCFTHIRLPLLLILYNRSDLIATFAASEAAQPEMWGGRNPTSDEAQQLAACFQYEWEMAVQNLLRHWHTSPTWY